MLVQHGEQTGGIRGLCAVAGLRPHWGHRKTWWDSSHDWGAAVNGHGLFGKDRPRRQGEGVAHYLREQQECTELCLGIGGETAGSLSVRIRWQTKMSFIVVGVCYRPPEQEEEVDELSSSDNWKKTHISQNDQMVEVGRELWRSSGPTPLLK